MNGTEQANHRRKTDELAEGIATLAEANADALALLRSDMRAGEMRSEALTRTLIGEERTHRLTLANEQRAYVDRAHAELMYTHAAFVHRGFWRRLGWLFFGK